MQCTGQRTTKFPVLFQPYLLQVMYVTPLWAGVIIDCLFLVKHFLQDHRYNSTDWWPDLMITKLTFIENLLPELHHGITTPTS